MRYEEDLVAYHERRRTAKPKFHLVCFEPTSLGWWGGVSYTTGALLYNIGAGLDDAWQAIISCLLRMRLNSMQCRPYKVLKTVRTCAGSTTAFANTFPSVVWSPHKVVRLCVFAHVAPQ